MKRISGVAEEKQTSFDRPKRSQLSYYIPSSSPAPTPVQKFDINIKKDRRHFVNALRNEGFHPIFKTERVEKKVTCTLNLFFNSKPITIVGSGDTEKIAKKKCPVTIARSSPQILNMK